jgi:hypothetical protein
MNLNGIAEGRDVACNVSTLPSYYHLYTRSRVNSINIEFNMDLTMF